MTLQDDPPCNTIAYRTIRRVEWLDPDDLCRIKAEAFMRRRPRSRLDGAHDPGDNDGLSLHDSLQINLEACVEETKSGHGVASVHVGTLRDHGLIVIRDPLDSRKLLTTFRAFEH